MLTMQKTQWIRTEIAFVGSLRLVLVPSQAPPKRGQGRLEAKSHHFDEELQRKNTPPERFYFLDFQGGSKGLPNTIAWALKNHPNAMYTVKSEMLGA